MTTTAQTADAREALLDATLTVNDVRARHPATAVVFTAFGIDSCCGGKRPVREAAAEAGVAPALLLAALADAIARASAAA